MVNKRQRKKNEKKELQRQVVQIKKNQGKSTKQAKKETLKLSKNTLTSILQTEAKKQKAKQQKLALRHRKQQFLQEQGINPFDYTLKDIDSIKVKDMQAGLFNRENYPQFFGGTFDFDKIYTLKNGERFYFAFRDFAGERDLETMISEYSYLSNERLLDRLTYLVNLKPAYNKSKRKKKGSKAGTSNGSAGDYKFICAPQNVIQAFNSDTQKENRKKSKRKQHSGTNSGYQVLKNGRFNSFDKVTPRQLMIIMCAIMDGVTEYDRVTFYRLTYNAIKKHMPDFAEVLPTPKYK